MTVTPSFGRRTPSRPKGFFDNKDFFERVISQRKELPDMREAHERGKKMFCLSPSFDHLTTDVDYADDVVIFEDLFDTVRQASFTATMFMIFVYLYFTQLFAAYVNKRASDCYHYCHRDIVMPLSMTYSDPTMGNDKMRRKSN